jgi:hypothetical protein
MAAPMPRVRPETNATRAIFRFLTGPARGMDARELIRREFMPA